MIDPQKTLEEIAILCSVPLREKGVLHKELTTFQTASKVLAVKKGTSFFQVIAWSRIQSQLAILRVVSRPCRTRYSKILVRLPYEEGAEIPYFES